jgi:hypothetical protein
MKLLSPPHQSSFPAHDGLRTQYWSYWTEEGTFELGLTYKEGTWEQPRGNGLPNPIQPEVIQMELTGPGYLDFEPPADASTVTIHTTDDMERQVSVWKDFAYFEQGHQGRPWMMARSVGRSTFHATSEERTILENVMIDLSDAMKEQDLDLQKYLATRAKEFAAGNDVYDFGIGTIHAVSPHFVRVSWIGPTKISRFFSHHGDVQIMTQFAHDYGEEAQTMDLGHVHLHSSDYYIRHPRMHHEESGLAASAHFRSITILRPPGAR